MLYMRIDRENYDNIKSSISMKNLKKIALNRGYTLVKIAMEAKISESTVNAYINGQKIPSLVIKPRVLATITMITPKIS